jgi:cell division protein FtsW (lipid II flippase)
VKLLRRVLVWQAALWAGFGLVLVIAPGWVVETVFDQPPLGEEAWLRVSGVMAIALAGMMVLVSHRVEDLWWWSWTFVILEVASSVVLVLNALVGVPEGAASWPWWLLAGVNAGFAVIELAALARIGGERPPG